MSNFTKGPWKCIEFEFGDYETGDVAFVVKSESSEIMVGSLSNCSLIAAAPEMYDFIESIENDLGLLPDFMVKMRAKVLAKARGEQ